MDNAETLSNEEIEARRQAERENAKRVMRESGLAEMLIAINKNLLKGRGTFEEYGSMVLLKWGTFTTRRHLWIDIRGNTLRFRLAPHLKCAAAAPLCDGEYHTFTSPMWADHTFLAAQLQKYYEKPVAETSDD